MRIFAAVKASLVYFELLTRYYGFGQCSDILPPPKKSNIYANRVSTEFNVFTMLSLFHDRKQKESTDYQTFKKLRTFLFGSYVF